MLYLPTYNNLNNIQVPHVKILNCFYSIATRTEKTIY